MAASKKQPATSKKSLPLTEELEKKIAEIKNDIETFEKERVLQNKTEMEKAGWLQKQKKAEEEKAELEKGSEERRRINWKYREIKDCKQGVEYWNGRIFQCKLKLQAYQQTKDKEHKSRKSKRLLNEALHAGHVKVRIIICLLLGLPGVGKTCLKALLLDRPPPIVRHSTPCAEKPTRVHIRSVSGLKVKAEKGSWKEVDEEQLSTLVAHAINALELIINKPIAQDTLQQLEDLINFEEAAPATDAAILSQCESTGMKQLHDQSPEFKKVVDIVLDKLVDQITECQESTAESANGKKDYVEKVFGSEWVYFTDSGGQPQFHEVLPLFIHNTSAALFVIRLSDSLDSYPLVEYYKDGKPVGTAKCSTVTTIDTLRCLIRSMQSRSTKGKLTKIIVVGTHRDLIEGCSEKLDEKNKRLLHMLREYTDSLVFFSQDLQQLIFPVDTAHPEKEEKKIAEDIRSLVEQTVVEEIKVPIWWYILELLLRQLAKELGREVLNRRECLEIAHALQFDEDAFDAALSFFHDLNVFHYYPDTLPEVVFVNSQVPLDKLTELVDFSFSLRQGTSDQASSSPLVGEWIRFRDQGIVEVKFLEKFQQHYVKGLFTPHSFLMLLNKLLIAAPLTDDTQPAALPNHFMPTLLNNLSNSELEKHRIFSSAAVPLLIRFPEGCPCAGVFCCLVIFLMNECGWKITHASGKLILVARNCIKFRLPKSTCYITLIDAFDYIEVHVNSPVNVCCRVCPTIQESIISGIEAAYAKLHYEHEFPHLALFCPHITDSDLLSNPSKLLEPSVEISKPNSEVRLSHEPTKLETTLSTQTSPAAKEVKPNRHVALLMVEDSCWMCTDTELYGTLNEMHTIWLFTQAPQTDGLLMSPYSKAIINSAAVRSESARTIEYPLVSMALINVLDWHKLGLLLGIKKLSSMKSD